MELTKEAQAAAEELCERAKLAIGDLMVVGCSSSEAAGKSIGTYSSEAVAQAILDGILPPLRERGIFLAAQCCEHLNRALIVEREAAERFGLTVVNAVPQPKAGGSFATAAYKAFSEPVTVLDLKQSAKAGMDIGATLIGMHLKPVVVPVRLNVNRIGEAILICARTRPPFVGGSRAVYDEALL